MSRRKVRETTKEFREKIQTLADYPHTCLREEVDIFESFLMASPLSLIGDLSATNNDSTNSSTSSGVVVEWALLRILLILQWLIQVIKWSN